MSAVSPSQSPGISTNSVPSGTERNRAIQAVVMSAATVIRRTATCQANSGCISSSTRRRAGSASLPVTKRTRLGGWAVNGVDVGVPPFRHSAIPPSLRIPRPYPLVWGSLERATCRLPQHYVFDLSRQLEILIGDAAGRVVLQLHPYLGPRHREIGMVIRRLGEKPNRVDQRQRGKPTIGLVLPPDPALF